MGYYTQDDWRVTDSLAANVGLRWEYFGRPGGSGNNKFVH